MYVVIFRAEVNEFDSGYTETAKCMRDLAIGQYGCREFVSATEGNTEIAISYWDSESQIRAWKQNTKHLVAQSKGRSLWYKSYSVEIAEITRQYDSGSEQ